MKIELNDTQASIVRSYLADAIDEILQTINKEYRKGRHDYVKILEKEYNDACEVFNKFIEEPLEQ